MRGKKILVIDDDQGILDALGAMLEMSGYSVSTSSSPDILTHLTADKLPDLILLDVLLSGVDGRTVCKMIKQNAKLRSIPVIMLSAHPGVAASIKSQGYADEFISKPFDMHTLLGKIQEYVY